MQLMIAALLAVVFFWGCLGRFGRIRSINNTPTSLIRSAAQGYCELIGSAKADQALLIAPLSGMPCLWFEYRVEKRVRTGKRYSWRTVRHERSSHSFFIDDTSGLCHVHPDGAEIDPVHRDSWNQSPAHFRVPGRSFGAGRYRYREQRISVGDLLYVLGNFQTVYPLSIAAQAEQHTIELLHEWKTDYDQLVQRFDADGDGQIDSAEWEQARLEAARHARLYTLENPDREPAHMLVQPPTRKQHFIVSGRDPKRIVNRYRWQAAFCGLAFLLCLAAIGAVSNGITL